MEFVASYPLGNRVFLFGGDHFYLLPVERFLFGGDHFYLLPVEHEHSCAIPLVKKPIVKGHHAQLPSLYFLPVIIIIIKCSHLQIWWRYGLPHNKIRDILVETCRRAHIGVQVEVGNNLTHDHNKTRPADILLSNWFLGKPAALDVSITSPLNPLTLLEAGVLAKSAAQVTEARKYQANDPKCSELGWVCVPMVAESYGAWGDEASSIISSIASRLATSTCKSKSVVLNDIYGWLNSI